jgi:hypothetical protein
MKLYIKCLTEVKHSTWEGDGWKAGIEDVLLEIQVEQARGRMLDYAGPSRLQAYLFVDGDRFPRRQFKSGVDLQLNDV